MPSTQARAGRAEEFPLQEMAYYRRRRQWTPGPGWAGVLAAAAGMLCRAGAPWVPSRSAGGWDRSSGRGHNATAACGLSLGIGHGQTAHVQRKCWCGHALEFGGATARAPRRLCQRPLSGLLRPSCLWATTGALGVHLLPLLFSKVEGEKWPTAISGGRGGSASGLCRTEPPAPGPCLPGSSGFYQSWLPYCVCSSFTQLHPKLVGFDAKSRLIFSDFARRAIWEDCLAHSLLSPCGGMAGTEAGAGQQPPCHAAPGVAPPPRAWPPLRAWGLCDLLVIGSEASWTTLQNGAKGGRRPGAAAGVWRRFLRDPMLWVLRAGHGFVFPRPQTRGCHRGGEAEVESGAVAPEQSRGEPECLFLLALPSRSTGGWVALTAPRVCPTALPNPKGPHEMLGGQGRPHCGGHSTSEDWRAGPR